MTTLSIVVFSRDDRDHLDACLDCLAAAAGQAGTPDFEVVVVDNGSVTAQGRYRELDRPDTALGALLVAT